MEDGQIITSYFISVHVFISTCRLLPINFQWRGLFSAIIEEIEITPNSMTCRATMDGLLSWDTWHHGVCYRRRVTGSCQDAQVRLLHAVKPTPCAHHAPGRANVGGGDCFQGLGWFESCPFLHKYLSKDFRTIQPFYIAPSYPLPPPKKSCSSMICMIRP